MGVVLLALVLTVVLPHPAGAVETPRLGIKPAHEADYFHISLLPGGRTTGAAVVSNYSQETSRVRVYAVDGGLTPQGHFALRGEGEPRTGVGAWLVPAVSTLTLAPRSSTEVPFSLAVPAGTVPSDYAGGIVIEGEPHAQPVQTIGGQTAVQLNVVERLGVRVYLRVEGTARAHMVAGPLTWARVPGGAIEFSSQLRNDGNVQLTPAGEVTLSGWGASHQSVTLSHPELLLPGVATTVRGRWSDPPLWMLGRATAVVTYGAGHHATTTSTVRLIPIMLTAALATALIALAYLTHRLVRFVRRARLALKIVGARH